MKKIPSYMYIFAIIILPVLGYGITYGLTVIFPITQLAGIPQAFLVLIITCFLLVVPYWMLKFMGTAAHRMDPEEKEFELEDLPKDKEQFDSSDGRPR